MEKGELQVIVKELLVLLQDSGDEFWFAKVSEALRLIEVGKVQSACRLISGWFGGAGSINDLILCLENGHNVTNYAYNRYNEQLSSIVEKLYDTCAEIRKSY